MTSKSSLAPCVEFYGAADGVTGSLHRLRVGEHDILLDCGLFQGHRAEANQRNRNLPAWASSADALILSHAHLDHSGSIPTLVKRGFKGTIYCTPPTRDLCSVMLRDAAMIQEQDASYLNRKLRRAGDKTIIEPLYDVEDAHRSMSHMVSVPYGRPIPVTTGVTLTFLNAGHVLGSALVQLDIEHRGVKRRLLFTGDLGRAELPLLAPPDITSDVDVLICESTYGDRFHPDISAMDDQLANIVKKTIARKGRVFIPTFALERAQEVLFSLYRLKSSGVLGDVPIYIDSPLAIKVTEIYKLHPEGLEPAVQDLILSREDPFAPPGLTYVSDVSASKALQASSEPCIVIAGSGMCEGGRILHHFGKGISDAKNSVIIVGFMAQHTLGRRIAERRPKVKVFGVMRERNAEVHTLSGLSAHADQRGLIEFIAESARRGSIKTLALVHGEDEARDTLAELARERGIANVLVPRPGTSMPL